MANTVDKVLKIAEAEVGYLEKKSNANLYDKTANAGMANYTKYGKEMHDLYPSIMDFPAAWCDCFVDWCFYKAYGISTAKSLLGGDFNDYTVASAQQYKNKNAWFTSNPKVGDQIFFKNSTRICHTGLVYAVDSTYVYTIEGNTSGGSTVVANGGGVFKKKYKLNYNKIAGYGRPKYDNTTTNTPNENPISSGNPIVKKGQKHAIEFTGKTIKVDGLVGNQTKEMKARVLQHAMNLDYKKNQIDEDGAFGPKSKLKLGTHYVKKGETQYMVTAAEILMELNGIDPDGVEYPGHYGNGLTKAAAKFFGNAGTKITASNFLKLIQ